MTTHQNKTPEKGLSITSTCQNCKNPCWKNRPLSNRYYEPISKETEKNYQKRQQ
jgi:hypothetical protein